MGKTAILTDTNSGLTQEMAKARGVFLLPMTFFINGKQYLEGVDLTQKEFFEMLSDPNTNVSTSQPSPGEVLSMWDKILKDYEELVYIPMSSGLSASCATATSLAEEYNGRVQVVNNQRISVTQLRSVDDAVFLAEQGWSAKDIKERLEKEKFESSIYIMVDTLKYLKKGGRVTPAAALIGSVLHIKPVLQIQGEKLDSFAKSRGVKAAKKTMLEAMHSDYDTRFAEYHKNGQMDLEFSYTYSDDESLIENWRQEIEASFPGYHVHGECLSLSIACHTGPGCLAIATAKKIDTLD